MLSKSEHAGSMGRHKKTTILSAPPSTESDRIPTPIGRIAAARAALHDFFSTELGAREIRVTKIAPLGHGSEGWLAEAEILVPNLEVKMLGLPLTQEVLECEHYVVELEPDLTIRSYGHLGQDSD
jgi:hypothetical protein